jgi:ABC-type oligopeptide transport system substrate-binding subunit
MPESSPSPLNRLFVLLPRTACLLSFILFLSSCQPNNPYPDEKQDANVLYSAFTDVPKHLDPAQAYSTDAAQFLYQIVEPPLQYHYLKRPYELIPLTAVQMPVPRYYDETGNLIPAEEADEIETDAPEDKTTAAEGEPAKNGAKRKIAKVVYEIELKKGVFYQPHPCFAKKDDGSYRWHNLKEEDLVGIYSIPDFKSGLEDTRELKAEDHLHQIQRMADKRIRCPIFSTMVEYILGYQEYSLELSQLIDQARAERLARDLRGELQSHERDEDKNPIVVDYNAAKLEGVKIIDDYRFQIILKKKYPQFRYWLAMTFFAPVPKEATLFYSQPLLRERNLTLNRWPLGTGPYRFQTLTPNYEIRLVRNELFRGEAYPTEGAPGDREKGLLDDAGRTGPFIDELVYKYERESVPYWHKFLQGYYDAAGVINEAFDSTLHFSDAGVSLADTLKEKDIRLDIEVEPTISYWFFNMKDKVVGGLDEKNRKLRQAVSIILDFERYLQIFNNGRGIAAQSLLPPGLFGWRDGKAGVNPYTHDWDEKKMMPVRKSVAEARQLMVEAGYPNGLDPATNKPLTITFCNSWTDPKAQQRLSWFQEQFKKIDVELISKSYSYGQFQTAILEGNFQCAMWGWHADYPDPENFMFLLYGLNGKVDYKGENNANYASPEYDALFKKMECMDNGPERQKLIDEAMEILRRDAPLCFGFNPTGFGLKHDWLRNAKTSPISYFTTKYHKIDGPLRARKRAEWNRPRWDVLLIPLAVLAALCVPAIVQATRHYTGGKTGSSANGDAAK